MSMPLLRKDLKPGTKFRYSVPSWGSPMWVPDGGPCPAEFVASTSPNIMDEVVVIELPPQTEIDPAHYKELAPEPILVMEGWGLDRNLSNVIKYVARAGKKTADATSDLKKARRFLTRAINLADGRATWDYSE